MIRTFRRGSMRLVKSMVIALLTFSVCTAFADERYESSALTPGARLLAGDPAQNEFYILGKDEPDPKINKPADAQLENKLEKETQSPEISTKQKETVFYKGNVKKALPQQTQKAPPTIKMPGKKVARNSKNNKPAKLVMLKHKKTLHHLVQLKAVKRALHTKKLLSSRKLKLRVAEKTSRSHQRYYYIQKF